MRLVHLLTAAVIVLITLATPAIAQQRQPERTGRSIVEDGQVKVMPKSTPDLAAFTAAITPGDASISGNAYTQGRVKMNKGWANALIGRRENKYPLNQASVYLLPFNDYMGQWLQLQMDEEARGRGVAVGIDRSVETMARQIITNSSGDFSFGKLMPGRYLIFSFPDWVYTVDTVENYLKSTRSYERRDFLYEIVDVPVGAELVQTTLTLKTIVFQREMYDDDEDDF